MKKERFFENLIMESKKVTNRKLVVRVAVIAVLILAMAVTTGCGKKRNKENTPVESSQSVTQEVTPSTSEAQESTAEVVESTESAPVETVKSTEEVKEENVEEIINSIDISKYHNLKECINDLKQYETLMIIVYNEQGVKEILVDGDSYTYDGNSGHESFYLNRLQEDSEIKETYIETDEINLYTQGNKGYSFPFETYFTDGLYTIVVVYNDGTKEELTIDFTFKQE